jgi:hypothetical protein
MAALNPALTVDANTYLATATAPENWEPLGSVPGNWTDTIMFRRCARWE